MNIRHIAVSMAVLGLAAAATAQTPVGTAITYEGQLKSGGSPANGNFNMTFGLFDAATAGNQVGPTLTFDGMGGNPAPVTITSGLFTVQLDFGTVFNGDKRWLEITVSGTTLSPREELTAAPHAQWSKAAASVPWSGITGAPTSVSGPYSWSVNTLVGWGDNEFGQVDVPSGIFTSVAAGYLHSLAIRTDGTLVGWGAGQVNVPSGVFSAIAAGNGFSLAIRTDGSLVGWGNNTFGQINVPAGTFTAVAAGYSHAVAIRTDGTLVGWGNNDFGQINVPSGTFSAIAAGSGYCLAIRSDGTLTGWGTNLGGETNVPSGTYMAVAAGEHHSLAIRTDGSLAGWGTVGSIHTPVPSGTYSAVAIDPENPSALAIRTDGTLVGWQFLTPLRTLPVPPGTFTAVAAGLYFNLALGPEMINSCNVTVHGGLTIDGVVKSGSGFQFPDGTLQTTADSWSLSGGYLHYNNGNVGIGTSVPANSLSVSGGADFAGYVGIGTTNPQGKLELQAGADQFGSGGQGAIVFSYASGGGYRHWIRSRHNSVADNGNAIEFFVNNSASAGDSSAPGTGNVQVLTLGGSGNVGIGNSNPSFKLDVSGSLRVTSCSGCSDARFKERVEPVAGALQKIERLRGVTFDWKCGEFPDRGFGEDRQVGLIAQEVRQVIPELVSEGRDGYLSVDYGRLTPILVEAVKEQQKQERATDAQIQSLKLENTRLQARLERLEVLISKTQSKEGVR